MRTYWKRAVLGVGAVLGVAVSTPAAAQGPTPGVDVSVPAPPFRAEPEFGIEPTAPREQRGVREQDFYQGLVRSGHDPAFVRPFVATAPVSRTSALRVGLSGWTAPVVPLAFLDAGGGLALGLTIQWGVPVPQGTAPPSQSGQR